MSSMKIFSVFLKERKQEHGKNKNDINLLICNNLDLVEAKTNEETEK